MPQERESPFDKEPAEGSRETVDRQLEKQDRATEHGSAGPVTAPGQARGTTGAKTPGR